MGQQFGQQLRIARTYDGQDGPGRQTADRATIDPRWRDAVLSYLESAPIILAARTFGPDEFQRTDHDVPLNFRTDGVWIWPGSVPHYLRKHGLLPDPDLLRHITTRGFRVDVVNGQTKNLAVDLILETTLSRQHS